MTATTNSNPAIASRRKKDLDDYAAMIVKAGEDLSKFREQYHEIYNKNKEYKDSEILFVDEFEELNEMIRGTEDFISSIGNHLSMIYGVIKKIELSDLIFKQCD